MKTEQNNIENIYFFSNEYSQFKMYPSLKWNKKLYHWKSAPNFKKL